jgi:hypothetical protein
MLPPQLMMVMGLAKEQKLQLFKIVMQYCTASLSHSAFRRFDEVLAKSAPI